MMRGIIACRGAAPLRNAAAVALAALLAAACFSPPARAANNVAFNRESYSFSTKYPISQEANMYQQIVLQSTDGKLVNQLKAANPKLKVFLYEGIMGAEDQPNNTNTCTSGTADLTSHPSWLLHDQNGSPILIKGIYLVDPANTAFQQACLANVIATAKASGFDGVYWDMVNQQLNWSLPAGHTVAKYASSSVWDAALSSILAYGEKQLHANGLQQWANIGGAYLTGGLWQSWNGLLDGAEDEAFTDPGSGLANGIWAWPYQVYEAAWSEANHKPVIMHSHNATEAGNTYGIASLMLVANGESSYSTSNNCYTSCEVWYPEYLQTLALGAPVGSYNKLSNGVYWRWFQHGMVMVNPTSSSVARFSLGGGTYSGSQLSNVSSVSLAPTTGYVLLANSGNVVKAPANTKAPAIGGTPAVGKPLLVLPGTWSGSPAPTYAYQWSRCSSTCTAIWTANSPSYVVQSGDAGYRFVVRVTATNSGGIASATSAATAVVP